MAALSANDKSGLLARVSLFAGLDRKELDALAAVARTKPLRSRELLFHKGDEGGQVYLVVSGKLKALTTSKEGDDVVFSILGPGEVFGEIALLAATQRTATVTAIDACELLVIDRRDFLSFLRSHPEVSIKLLVVLAERLKRVSELVEDTLFLNLPVRLAKKFASLACRYGEPIDGGVRINLKLSQEEWGDLVGATRESINKQLRAWSQEGIIEVDKGFVLIRQPERLEKLARSVLV
jgi:CRP-like cAMP-binding protein